MLKQRLPTEGARQVNIGLIEAVKSTAFPRVKVANCVSTYNKHVV